MSVNQITQAIGVQIGNPEREYGGRCIPYAAVIRVKMLTPDRSDEGVIVFRPKTIKNKTAQPGREARVTLLINAKPMFVDIVPELTSVGKDLLVFTREDGSPISGSANWFFQGEKMGLGEGQVMLALYSAENLRNRVELSVREAIAALNAAPIVPANVEPESGECDE